jgi:two-component system sensor histidine kinase KdpD
MALERQTLSDRQQEITLEAQTERLRTNLLRSVSHDLRTPLTSIIGASSAILENRDLISPETHDKLVSDINKEAKWLIHMVENLLAVTRISGNPIRLAKSPEAAEEIAAEAAGRVRASYPQAKIRVKVPEEFLMVPMDATLIEQVIINLLENSIQHSGSDAPVELKVTADETDAVFTVRDRGHGISEEELPFLFEGNRPEQGRKSDSSRGMGIGLSICKSIVRAHGGTITAGNGENGGAVFTFTLPLKEDAPNE